MTNAKSQTNPNDQIPMCNGTCHCWSWVLGHWLFGFVWSLVLGFWSFAGATSICAQEVTQLPPLDGREGRQLLLENFRPIPMLKFERHEPVHAKFPVVDVH